MTFNRFKLLYVSKHLIEVDQPITQIGIGAFLSHLIIILLLSLPNTGRAAEASRPTIVTSIRPLELLVRDLAGDDFQVQSVVHRSESPHHIQLKASQFRAIKQADLVVWLHPNFEYFMAKAIKTLPSENIITLADNPSLVWPDRQYSHNEKSTIFGRNHIHESHVHENHSHDYHLWLDPRNVAEIAKHISAKLIEIQPSVSTKILGRQAVFLSAFEQLDDFWQKKFVHFDHKPYLVYHDAYSHFENYFGLFAGKSVNEVPDEQLSARHLLSLKQYSKNSVCLLADVNEVEFADKLAQHLNLPIVELDLLAVQIELSKSNFLGYFEHFIDDFRKCFET